MEPGCNAYTECVCIVQAKALHWMRQSAALGHPAAINGVGLMCEQGDVPGGVDYTSARVMYEVAAGKGSADAAFNMALLHERGHGLPVSLKAALHWSVRRLCMCVRRQLLVLRQRAACGCLTGESVT